MTKFKKIVIPALVSAVLIVSSILSMPKANVSAKNIEVKNGKVRVILGSSIFDNEEEKTKYVEDRKKILKEKFDKESNTISKANITFSKFLTVDDLEHLIKENSGISIERIWFSIPGQVGRSATVVKNNNIKVALDKFFLDTTEKKLNDKNLESSIQTMANSNIGIFSITVTAQHKELYKLNNDKNVSLVDIYYNQIAEEKAAKESKPLVFVELPQKPDGTK